MIKRIFLLVVMALAIFGTIKLTEAVFDAFVVEKPVDIFDYHRNSHEELENQAKKILSQDRYNSISISKNTVNSHTKKVITILSADLEISLIITSSPSGNFTIQPGEKPLSVIDKNIDATKKFSQVKAVFEKYKLNINDINQWVSFLKAHDLNYVSRRGNSVAFSIKTAGQKLIYTPIGIDEMPFGVGNGSPMIKIDGQWTYYRGDL